jgi:hypothetical protein
MQPNPKKVQKIMTKALQQECIKKKLKALYRDHKIGEQDHIALTLYKSKKKMASVDISPSHCSDIVLDELESVRDCLWTEFPQGIITDYLEAMNESDPEFLEALGIALPVLEDVNDIEVTLQASRKDADRTLTPFKVTLAADCIRCGRRCCF